MPDAEGAGREVPLGRSLSRRRFLELAALAVPAGAALAACGGSGGPKATGPKSSLPSFPIGATSKATTKPTTVTLWHSMSGDNQTVLNHLTDQFNASQGDVKVSLVAQSGYPATLSAYTAALSGGGLPDVVQMETTDLQLMIDSQSTVPVQAAVDADHYSLSDFLPSTVEYFKVGGVLQAMPFNISTQVLYYDTGAFSRAKLDPDSPPKTLDALRAAAEQIVHSGTSKYGMSIKLTDSNIEQWIALGDGLLVLPDNGRSARATSVAFGDTLGTSVFDWVAGMFGNKYAQPTSGSGYDNLFAIPSKIAPMTTDTSAALGTITALLANNQFPGVALGVGPLPGPLASGGGVTVGGAGLYLVSASSPARQDGAWQYVKFLCTPASQATWAAGTGYLPVRHSATAVSTLQKAWTSVPGFKIAFDQLASSPADAATAGAVTGAMPDIETAITNALTAISNGTSASSAVSQAVQTSNQAISSYNSSIAS